MSIEVYKSLRFCGSLKKAYDSDENPIDNFCATVHFYKNGQVLLESDKEVAQKISTKVFRESLLKISESLPETVSKPAYRGDYKAIGKTEEGRSFSAFTSFSQINSDKINLFDVRIGNPSELSKKSIIAARYCLAKLPIYSKTSTYFFDCEDGLVFTPTGYIDSDKEEKKIPTTLMEFKSEQAISGENYDKHSGWFKLLLSFASGYNTQEIYEVKVFKNGDDIQEVEYWSGDQCISPKRDGFRIIEQLEKFLHKVASAVTSENFEDKGLGLALTWYIDSWDTNVAPVSFILMCTLLETLNKRYSNTCSRKISGRLLSKQNFKAVKSKILSLLDEEKVKFDGENLEKYNIFVKKIKADLDSGKNNQVGPLRSSLKSMFQDYRVKYEDLFENLEFISVRDSLIHEGHVEFDAIKENTVKFQNLIVRIVLSILEYEGYYWELEKVEFIDPPQHHVYDRKHILFELAAVKNQT